MEGSMLFKGFKLIIAPIAVSSLMFFFSPRISIGQDLSRHSEEMVPYLAANGPCLPPCSTIQHHPTNTLIKFHLDTNCPPPCPTKPYKPQFIKKVQRVLDKNGYNLKVDGYLGPKTHKAIVQYQKAHSLKNTGFIDAATRKALGL